LLGNLTSYNKNTARIVLQQTLWRQVHISQTKVTLTHCSEARGRAEL